MPDLSPFAEQPGTAPFFDALGRILIAWSRIERAIDITIRYGRRIDPDLRERKKAPRTFSGKLDVFRRISMNHPKTAHVTAWLDAHLTEIEQAAQARNVLVHGYCDGLSDDRDPKIRFRASIYDPGRVEHRDLALTFGELAEFVHRLREIDHYTTMIMLVILTEARKAPQTTE